MSFHEKRAMAWNRNPVLYATPREARERNRSVVNTDPTRQEISLVKHLVVGHRTAVVRAARRAAQADAIVGSPVNGPTARAAAYRAARARIMIQHVEAHTDYLMDTLNQIDPHRLADVKVPGYPDPPQRRRAP